MMRKRSRQPRIAVIRHDRFPGDPHLRRNVDALRDAGLAVDVICDREPNLPGVTVLRRLFGHTRQSLPLQADVGVVAMWADFFFPNKLTEYLALGLPVIITDCPAVRLSFDDSAVYYVAVKRPEARAEAILDLYRNPARRASFAAVGHSAYREKMSWDRTKRDYLAVYGVHPSPIC
jgi:hypothetical protein